MVRSVPLVLWFLVATLVLGQEAGEPTSEEATGPVLYGDGGGRLWRWEAGEKTWLTAEGQHCVLGGVGTDQLWGWSVQGDVARFFTLALASPDADTPELPVFDDQPYPAPDRADRVGDRLLLVYGARGGHPRYEVWQGDQQLASRAWDDGRTVYTLALGPESGWMVAGRTGEGLPWLEVSGNPIFAPEGWRGRLTVVAWVPEKQETQAKQTKKAPSNDAQPPEPPVVHPRAAGWGAPANLSPRPMLWGPEGWTQPDAPEESGTAGTYPVLGAAGEGTLALAGWQADGGTGALRPWFWNGEAAEVPGGTADGQPQAFSAGGKTGPALVVAHQSVPWFTLEDGKTSVPLEGLDQGDRVVAFEVLGDETSP